MRGRTVDRGEARPASAGRTVAGTWTSLRQPMALEADLFTIMLSRRPGHGPPAEQMEVKVKHGLAAVPTAVRHDPIAMFA